MVITVASPCRRAATLVALSLRDFTFLPLSLSSTKSASFSSCNTSTSTSSTSEEEELDLFRDQVKTFAQNEIAPLAAEIDETNAFPESVNLWTKMGDFGLHGLTVPEHKGVSV